MTIQIKLTLGRWLEAILGNSHWDKQDEVNNSFAISTAFIRSYLVQEAQEMPATLANSMTCFPPEASNTRRL